MSQTSDRKNVRSPLERRSPVLARWFSRYVRRYLRRNFHAVRLTNDSRPVDVDGGPLVVVFNHPSWWDPLVAFYLTGLFPGRTAYGPIESTALAKYRFFERLGFFGIESGTAAGGLAFLRLAGEILSRPGTALWVTAQGHFCDPRERPVRLRPGVGHLVRRLRGGAILPLALEYPFWDERFPEALAHFGRPIPIGDGAERTVEEWMSRIEAGLTDAQDMLAAAARSRAPARFELLIGGNSGVGGVYDWWRRLRALLRGERFSADHGREEASTVLGGAP